jgi:tetratricopeptide (TPR) repeat protein
MRRQAILPITFVIAFALYFLARVPPLGAMCVMGAGLVFYTWAPILARDARDAYDRAALALLTKGKGAELRARLDGAWMFRAFAPPGEIAARRGAALAGSARWKDAAAAWREAVLAYPKGTPRAVALGFAHGAFEGGRDGDAVAGYRALLERDPGLPRVKVRLAHALARLGEQLDEADALLTAAESGGEAKSSEVVIARAAWLAAQGRKKEARASLATLTDIPAHLVDEVAALRAAAKKKG